MKYYEDLCILLKKLCHGSALSEDSYRLEQTQLSKLTSFRTGGPCLALYPLTEEALICLFTSLKSSHIPMFVLGNGTNVIGRDDGYDGVILVLTELKAARVEEDRIIAQCGASVTAMANLAEKNALSGMEFLYGIPGSVGGAVFMNAGAYGGECRDILESVTCVTADGTRMTLPAEALNLSYRSSVFQQNGALILSASFRLKRGERAEIHALMEDLMHRRIDKQPLDYPSAGSTFKRCEGRFTAKMIEEAGLKGYRIGGAMVSEKHAGFVINFDSAKSQDIFDLIEYIKEQILQREGVRISCEVRVIE